MSKNIVVLSDGTGQEGGRGHDTNIYKLFRMLEDRSERQIVFYDQGLGTDWRKVTGNAFGAGFSKNILQCYRFIYDNYEAGDKIFLLGFSRGAATVRSLANFIHFFGILPKARPELIKRAWKIYRRGKQARPQEVQEDTSGHGFVQRLAGQGFDLIDRTTERVDSFLRAPLNERAQAFVREHPNQWASIEFLGVWDTVPALGLVPLAGFNVLINNIPWWKHRFHDFKLHGSVRHAYHALAVDDDRLWFHPTVWKECGEHQLVEQVWFSGSHTDVGGGFREAGLSDVSFEWMVEKAIAHGLRLYLRSRKYWNFAIAPDGTDLHHPPRDGFGKIYAYAERDEVWDATAYNSYGPPKVHESVLERAAQDPSYRPWILKKYAVYIGRLPDQFAKWLQAEHRLGFDRAFEAYYEALMSEPAEAVESEAPLPESREAWLEANPFPQWLEKEHPDYVKRLQNEEDTAALLDWLSTYPPYRTWLAATYPQFTDTEFGPVMVERPRPMFQYTDSGGGVHHGVDDLDDTAMRERGFTRKQPLKFRDYDRATLAKMVEDGLEHSPRGAFENLLERVIKRVKDKVFNRYRYDRMRWYG